MRWPSAGRRIVPLSGKPRDVAGGSFSAPARRRGVAPLTDKVIADQQSVADTLFELGLLPMKIVVSDAVIRTAG